MDLPNAAASNAVISGINSKDAACLRLTGISAKTDNHASAAAELRSAGENGAHAALTRQMATTLGRLLRLKGRSQYQAADVARADAVKAVDRARQLLDDASVIVRG